jgi:hypothetical protein
MHKLAGILVVPAEHLKNTPQAFQQYVADYFEKKEVFGKSCLVAFQALSVNHHRKVPGVAPCHSVELMCYKEGLDGRDLNEWIRSEVKNGAIWQSEKSWDDGCGGSVLDD